MRVRGFEVFAKGVPKMHLGTLSVHSVGRKVENVIVYILLFQTFRTYDLFIIFVCHIQVPKE